MLVITAVGRGGAGGGTRGAGWRRRWLAPLVALPIALAAPEAAAVRTPDKLAERPLETADGQARIARTGASRPPTAAQAARWQRFTGAHGRWQASWDVETAVPARLWGEGIAAPGANADPAIALAAARALLAEQLALLAPGSQLADWRPAANVVHGRGGALRSVGFVQTFAGLDVQGGAVGFLFRNDRLFVISSAARPDVAVAVPAQIADGRAAAVAWIASIYGGAPAVRSVGAVSILPIVRGAGAIEYRAVVTVDVELAAPRARWDVYVDAATGRPVARAQRLRFGAGSVAYEAPRRNPRDGSADLAAAFAGLTLGGEPLTTDVAGAFGYAGAGPAGVVAGVVGPYVQVTSAGGPGATAPLDVPDGGAATWTGTDVAVRAQRSAFVHLNRVAAFARAALDPTAAWLDRPLAVDVNIDAECNAFSDETGLHFFRAGTMCGNSALYADVVYHEFGHQLHDHAIIPGVGAHDASVSEGMSDYLTATMVEDAASGRGFYLAFPDQPVRDLDPPDREWLYPPTFFDPHYVGMIVGGALWDLRKAMIARDGHDAGKRAVDDYYYAILRRSTDLLSTYPEVLAADDDDGDLANGTPNQCLIDDAFARHGLLDLERDLGFGRASLVRDGHAFTFTSAPPRPCAGTAVARVTVQWRPRGFAFTETELVASGATFTGAIPTQPDGTVVEYRVTVRLGNGFAVTYPDNEGDPLAQLYVGPTIPLYCTDFETDPFAAGWTHAATDGLDDWQWGAPGGAPDPATAASGSRVVGQRLDGDGRYRLSSAESLSSPVIDTRGKRGVRLQYRRWLTTRDASIDPARVSADGAPVWSSLATQFGDVSSVDREWRFVDHDLDDAAADGSVQVRFDHTSFPQGIGSGGWTIDDFCVVAQAVGARCGDGQVDDPETCDDGNTAAGDGCSDACVDEAPPPPPPDDLDEGGCCATGADPRGALGLGLGTALMLWRRRRRR